MSAMLEGFLLGIIVSASLTASLYFFKFWRQTHDSLFLAFGIAFLIEGVNRAGFLLLESPKVGASGLYGVRLLSYLLILLAIAGKNLRR